MPRTNYATPLDAIRKVDPTLGRDDLLDDEVTNNNDEEILLSRIEGAESEFETDTGSAFREVTVGGGTGTYVYLEARGGNFPVSLYTRHRPVVPLDSSQGDALEIRTGRNTWDDVTGQEGDQWVADYRLGKFTVYRMPGIGHLPMLHNFRERFARIRYRYGAAGGRNDWGGQTTITSQLSSGSTSTVGVGDASRLPQGGHTMLLGGEEYVRVSNVDITNDQVDVDARGLRLTKDRDHPSGTVLHYCPMRVREAVAAWAAHEVIRNDDEIHLLKPTDDSVEVREKLKELKNEYQNAVARYTNVYSG